ncbi:MAG: efflux RND transporter periplasmic adaptor subunit [Sphingomonadales bacterium]|nr:efflux RND transporter periplasmic adaptor subunit [Sphingomonadales bacterium]
MIPPETALPEPIHIPEEDLAPSNARLKRWGVGAAVVALVIAAAGVVSRVHNDHALRESAAEAAIPVVTVVHPTPAVSAPLVLPAQIEAFNSAAIFARTNGYVSRWLVDIGQHVRAGQVLATLDAPDLDQQLAQARADYETALANQHLAEITARRWKSMLAQDAVSRQETDEKEGDLAAKQALSNAALANVRRLVATEGFTQLAAPFAGVVSSRGTQIGQLVVAGTANSAPLFTISDVHRMRIFVRVPQSSAGQVHDGMSATLTVPEYPTRQYVATLVHNSQAVDTRSGSVLVELQIDNPDGTLKPGAFAQVTFPGGSGGALAGDMAIPGSAVLYTNSGPTIALVDGHGRVTVRPVRIARDAGTTVTVSGIAADDRVIDSPPDSIRSGDRVQVGAGPHAG